MPLRERSVRLTGSCFTSSRCMETRLLLSKYAHSAQSRRGAHTSRSRAANVLFTSLTSGKQKIIETIQWPGKGLTNGESEPGLRWHCARKAGYWGQFSCTAAKF